MPHILRGVALLSVDAVMAPSAPRAAAWERLVRDLPAQVLETVARVEPLSAVPNLAQQILDGRVRGRVLVDVTS